MNKKRDASKGSYVVTRYKRGRNIEVHLVGFKSSVIDAFQEEMREIYESEKSGARRKKVTGASKQAG